MSTVPTNDEQLRAEVRVRYARTALQVLGTEQPQAASCCSPTCCTPGSAESTGTQAVVQVREPETAQPSTCCASSCCSGSDANPVTADL
jgi:arsenite methyltransferase